MKLEFREIKASEIELRVGAVTPKGYTLLAYKNARVDMAILDETVGQMNWQRDHKEVKGNLYCGVGVWDEDKQQWIWKWDCGAESFSDKEKGEASDSFKRACFNLGIGRSLYSSPFIWIECDCPDKKMPIEEQRRVKNMRVSTYEVVDGIVTKFEIVDANGKSVFRYGIAPNQNKKEIHLQHKGAPIAVTADSIQAMQEIDSELSTNFPDLYKKVQEYRIEITKLAPVFEIPLWELSIEDIQTAVELKENKEKDGKTNKK